jgi:hypothetical protein
LDGPFRITGGLQACACLKLQQFKEVDETREKEEGNTKGLVLVGVVVVVFG